MEFLSAVPEQVVLGLLVSAAIALLALLWRTTMRALVSMSRRPAKGWCDSINLAFDGRAQTIRQIESEPEIEVLGQPVSLTSEQEEFATRKRLELTSLGCSNDLHGVLVEEPRWESSRIKLKVAPLDFAALLALRDAGECPPILSASAVIVCPELRQIVLHSRDVKSETYPGRLHTVGGAFQPAVEHRSSSDHRSLIATLHREVLEETGLDLRRIGGRTPMILSRELETGFVQLVLLGETVTREQVHRVEDSWEGQTVLYSVDDLPDLVCGNMVPSGAMHLLAWLAFGAPGLGVSRRIAKRSPRRLFADLVEATAAVEQRDATSDAEEVPTWT